MDPDGRIVVAISWNFNMQGTNRHGSTAGEWGGHHISGTSQALENGGCAIALVANIVSTNTGNIDTTPETINNEASNFTPAGLHWQQALTNSSVPITTANSVGGSLTADQFAEFQESSTSYNIGIKVMYDQSGEADHWVGTNDIVTRNGQQYFSITPTSANDSVLGFSETNNRGGRGWQTDVNAQGEITAIYVPLNQVTEYRVFTIDE